MIKIRLSRQGSTNNAFYRIVAVDEKIKGTGKALDILGYWHPSKNVKTIDKDKVTKWVKVGAQKSEAVEKLLK